MVATDLIHYGVNSMHPNNREWRGNDCRDEPVNNVGVGMHAIMRRRCSPHLQPQIFPVPTAGAGRLLNDGRHHGQTYLLFGYSHVVTYMRMVSCTMHHGVRS